MCTAKTLPSWGSLSILCTMSLRRGSCWLQRSETPVFSSIDYTFGVNFKEVTAKPKDAYIFYVIFKKFHSFHFTLGLWPNLRETLWRVWCQCLHSFVVTEGPDASVLLVLKTIFSPPNCLCSFVKSHFIFYESTSMAFIWIYFWVPYSVPLIQLSALWSTHTVLLTGALP